MSRIYMDHAATTPVRPEVREAMLPYLGEEFGNPSSIYSWGREAAEVLESSRERVAGLINARPTEIVFTGGGSESDNQAIKGVALACRDRGRHLITTAIEHHAVFDAARFLERFGFDVTFVPVDRYGMVDPDDVRKAIRDDTVLISVMHANNEVGTVQPVEEIGKIAREHGIYFHTDAVQTAGVLPLDVQTMNCDLLSISAHKFYGPKGVGVLYIRNGTSVVPLIHGGAQERNRRAGTENVAGIAGLAKALELAVAEMGEVQPRIRGLRDKLIKGVEDTVEHVQLTGHREQRLPGSASFCFEFIEGESLLLHLDMQGIAASSGSACTSGSLEPSHVLLAMGLRHEIAHGSLRLTLGRDNTAGDVDLVLDAIPGIVQKLRMMSPLYNK